MAVLADTSVWVKHLRKNLESFAQALRHSKILIHPCVVGELACGNLAQRRKVLHLLVLLPQAKIVRDGEALAFIEDRKLFGRGLGWVDIQLLASSLVSGVKLWTLDKTLKRAAENLGVAYIHDKT